MSRLRQHLTYANVTSTIALCLALGAGTAFATGRLAARSVGAPQLRPGAVTADKLRKQAVTAPKIEAGAVKQGKIAGDAVTGAKIASGVVDTSKLANGAVTDEKVAADAITGDKVLESSLGQVPKAARADSAAFADAASPEAFAKVDAEGTLFPAGSKGIEVADVKQGPLPGTYCIAVRGFVPRGAQATPEVAANNSVTVFVKLGGTETCPAPQIEVRTYSAGSTQKAPFYLVAYR